MAVEEDQVRPAVMGADVVLHAVDELVPLLVVVVARLGQGNVGVVDPVKIAEVRAGRAEEYGVRPAP